VLKTINLAKSVWNKAFLDNFNIFDWTDESAEAEVALISIERGISAASFPKLKYILSPTTGSDHIPAGPWQIYKLEPSEQDDYNFLQSEVWSTAEHTIGLIISLLKNYPEEFKNCHVGRFERTLKGQTLRDKTLGLIGYGRVAHQVEQLALGMGMAPYAVESLHGYPEPCDIYSIHLSLNKHTESVINGDFISRLKPGSYLINTARAQIVREHAILEALKSGHLLGYAADVCDLEWDSHSWLWQARNDYNIIFTSHIAGYTKEDVHRTARYVLRKFLKAQVPNSQKGYKWSKAQSAKSVLSV